MDTNQRAQSDGLLRTAVISGGLVTLAAIIGADRLAASATSAAGPHRSHIVVIRAAGAPGTTRLTSATGLGWTAGAALVLLLLRRSPLPLGSIGDKPRLGMCADASPAPLLLRRKCAISTRSGGLYGAA